MNGSNRRLAALAIGVLGLTGCGTPAGTSAAGAPASTPAEARPSALAGTHRPGSPSPVAASSSPTVEPEATAAPSVDPASSALPTRVVVADLGIDLPVVSGDLDVPGNPPDYPLCDVAQYLTTYRFPGRTGTTTWVYAHAREGMFLPLLEASERDDGAELVGKVVELYSDAGRRYTYRITEVARHATDRGIARDVPADGRRLVLQTSEGPRGTVPKLQIAAELIDEAPAELSEAMPPASPRACYIR